MLVIFTVILLGLLVLGLPVAFSLGTAGNYGKDRFWGDRCTGYHGESDEEKEDVSTTEELQHY